MSVLPADLLTRPAAQSTRLVARGFLDAAVQAAGRLSGVRQREDAAALHDFRVALRRLRTTLRAYRPELRNGIPASLEHRLHAIAAATNRAREAEVAIAWLCPLQRRLKPGERAGWHSLLERIERRRVEGLRHAADRGWKTFTAVAPTLRRGLTKPAAASPPFAVVARVALLRQARRLDTLLPAVHDAADPKAHRARIAAKRLRYLLEALVGVVPAAAALVKRLRALQDGLGELHDVLELESEVGAAATTRRRDQKVGLLALARRLRARRTALFAKLRVRWLGRDGSWSRDVAAAFAPQARSA